VPASNNEACLRKSRLFSITVKVYALDYGSKLNSFLPTGGGKRGFTGRIRTIKNTNGLYAGGRNFEGVIFRLGRKLGADMAGEGYAIINGDGARSGEDDGDTIDGTHTDVGDCHIGSFKPLFGYPAKRYGIYHGVFLKKALSLGAKVTEKRHDNVYKGRV
jgi:hypothetical protein